MGLSLGSYQPSIPLFFRRTHQQQRCLGAELPAERLDQGCLSAEGPMEAQNGNTSGQGRQWPEFWKKPCGALSPTSPAAQYNEKLSVCVCLLGHLELVLKGEQLGHNQDIIGFSWVCVVT